MRNTITKSGGDYYKTLLQQQERPIRRKGTNGRGDYDFLNNAADDDRPNGIFELLFKGFEATDEKSSLCLSRFLLARSVARDGLKLESGALLSFSFFLRGDVTWFFWRRSDTRREQKRESRVVEAVLSLSSHLSY